MEINYEWQRRHVLRRFRDGFIRRDDLCDADALLIAAAEFHGEPAGIPCPICAGSHLLRVHWVYGDALGHASGSARSAAERERLRAVDGIYTTHVVEVCPDCRWNHLIKATTPDDTVPDGVAPGPIVRQESALSGMMTDDQFSPDADGSVQGPHVSDDGNQDSVPGDPLHQPGDTGGAGLVAHEGQQPVNERLLLPYAPDFENDLP